MKHFLIKATQTMLVIMFTHSKLHVPPNLYQISSGFLKFFKFHFLSNLIKLIHFDHLTSLTVFFLDNLIIIHINIYSFRGISFHILHVFLGEP